MSCANVGLDSLGAVGSAHWADVTKMLTEELGKYFGLKQAEAHLNGFFVISTPRTRGFLNYYLTFLPSRGNARELG